MRLWQPICFPLGMANGKTHFWTGFGVAAVSNYYSQQERQEAHTKKTTNWVELGVVAFSGGFVAKIADILEPADSPNHRRFFHSIFFGLFLVWAFGQIVRGITKTNAGYCRDLGLAYLSHLALDACTPRCLPWFGLGRIIRLF
jgi:inner membrane protein